MYFHSRKCTWKCRLENGGHFGFKFFYQFPTNNTSALVRVMDWCRTDKKATIRDDVIKWKHFPRYWPFVREIHWLPVNSPHKGQWRGALMFFFYLNQQLGKQWRCRWFETPSRSLWRHCNTETILSRVHYTTLAHNELRPLWLFTVSNWKAFRHEQNSCRFADGILMHYFEWNARISNKTFIAIIS